MDANLCPITGPNRRQLFLFDMQSKTFGPYSTTVHRILFRKCLSVASSSQSSCVPMSPTADIWSYLACRIGIYSAAAPGGSCHLRRNERRRRADVSARQARSSAAPPPQHSTPCCSVFCPCQARPREPENIAGQQDTHYGNQWDTLDPFSLECIVGHFVSH
jgi:hypothetical protein